MASMVNEAQAVSQTTVEQTEVSEGTKFARDGALEETVGLIFGVMTVAYIIMSLTALAP